VTYFLLTKMLIIACQYVYACYSVLLLVYSVFLLVDLPAALTACTKPFSYLIQGVSLLFFSNFPDE
jgi:hypothetical protein